MDISSQIPSLPPPPGVKSNFVDPPNNAPILYAISYVFFGITTLGVIARLYTVAVVMKKIHLEDYSLVIGWFGVLAFLILSMLLEPFVGRHQWDVNLDQAKSLLTAFNAVQIAYVPPMLFLKLAIILQLKRIFTGPRRNLTWLSFQALVWLNPLFFAIILIFTSIRCIPRARLTNPKVPGVCFSYPAILIVTSCFNTLFDFLVLLLPLYIISRLSITTKQKASILAVFAVGFLGCISSAVRIYYTEKLLSEKDITFDILPVGFTAVLEFSSALLVACLPVMPALYQHVRQKITACRAKVKQPSDSRSSWLQDKRDQISKEQFSSNEAFRPDPPPKDRVKDRVKEVQQTWLAVEDSLLSGNREHSSLQIPPRALTPGVVVREKRIEGRTGKRVREIRFHARDLVDREL